MDKSNVTFSEDLFFNAGKELGYQVRLDSNGPQRIGKQARYSYSRFGAVRTVSNFLCNSLILAFFRLQPSGIQQEEGSACEYLLSLCAAD